MAYFATFRVRCDSLKQVEEVRAMMGRLAGVEEGEVFLEDGRTVLTASMAREIQTIEAGEDPADPENMADGV